MSFKVIKDFLEMVANCGELKDAPYRNPSDFILKHGIEQVKLSPMKVKRGMPKMCFQNAYVLARKHSDTLTYCEGYSLSNDLGLPIYHGWCLDKAGMIVDNTWTRIGDAPAYEPSRGDFYFGVPIDLETVKAVRKGTKTSCIIDNYEGGFKLLRNAAWKPPSVGVAV